MFQRTSFVDDLSEDAQQFFVVERPVIRFLHSQEDFLFAAIILNRQPVGGFDLADFRDAAGALVQ